MCAVPIARIMVVASLLAIACATHGCAATHRPKALPLPQLLAVALDAAAKERLDVGAYTASPKWCGDVYTVAFLRKCDPDVRRGFPVHFVVRVSGRGRATILKGIDEATAVSIAKKKARSVGCESFAVTKARRVPEGGSWWVLFEGGPTFPEDPADPESLTRAGRPYRQSFGVWVHPDRSTYVSWGR